MKHKEHKRNRDNWTDADWAKHLGVEESKVPEIRDFVENNYFIYISRFITETFNGKYDNLYHVGMDRRHDKPSGSVRFIPLFTDNTGFYSAEDAAKYANKYLIPTLELTELLSKITEIPVRALQLLKVKTK